MADTKIIAGAVVLAGALSSFATAELTTTFDASASPSHVRFLPDGQVAVGFATKIGDCRSERELVYGVDVPDGGIPDGGAALLPLNGKALLNGRPTDESTARACAAVVEQAKQAAASIDKSIADGVVEVRYLADGQTALTLVRHEEGQPDTHAELVVDADGGTPRLNGVPVPEDATLKAASDAARAVQVAGKDIDTETLTKPLEAIAPATK